MDAIPSDPTQEIPVEELEVFQQRAVQRYWEHQAQIPPFAPADASDIPPSPDFLRIIPHNEAARLAFSDLVEKNSSGELRVHHAQYLVSNGKGPLENTIAFGPGSTDEDTDEGSGAQLRPQVINLGWFRVNLNCARVATGGKWAIGRGTNKKTWIENRNVDILLAAPNSVYKQRLRPTHAYLKIHPGSGVWMIGASLDSGRVPQTSGDGQPLSPKATVFLDDKKIVPEQLQCLTQPRTRLIINGMEYVVEFTLKNLDEAKQFRDMRNDILSRDGVPPPTTRLTGIPLQSDYPVGDLVVISLGLGSGSYGSIYEGFNPVSGDPRAVKEFIVNAPAMGNSLLPEIQMNKQFPNSRGLVRQYGWCNSNGDPTLKVDSYPLRVYLVLEKGTDFRKCNWTEGALKSPATRQHLCRDLLHGLATIHHQGWIHRDVTAQNLLYFEAKETSSEPERAAVCDFGKLCFQSTHNATSLAAWDFLPPEIEQGRSNPYNQSIDVWMLGLALVTVWFPNALNANTPRRQNHQLTTKAIEEIRAFLRYEGSSLARILYGMIHTSPGSRQPAAKLLEDAAFRNLDASPVKLAKPDSGSFSRLAVTKEDEERQALEPGR